MRYVVSAEIVQASIPLKSRELTFLPLSMIKDTKELQAMVKNDKNKYLNLHLHVENRNTGRYESWLLRKDSPFIGNDIER